MSKKRSTSLHPVLLPEGQKSIDFCDELSAAELDALATGEMTISEFFASRGVPYSARAAGNLIRAQQEFIDKFNS